MKKSEFDVSGVFDAGKGERVKLNATYYNDTMSLQVNSYGDFKQFVDENCVFEETSVEIPLSINQVNGVDNEDNRFIGKLELKFSSLNEEILTPLSYYTDVVIHIVDLKTNQMHIIGGIAGFYYLLYDTKNNMMEKVDIESNSSMIVQGTASTELINEILQLNHMNMKYVDMKKDIKPETENQKPMLISQVIWEQFKFISLGYLKPLLGMLILFSIGILVMTASVSVTKTIVLDWMNLANVIEKYLGFPEQASQNTCGGIIIFISIILTSHILRVSRIPQSINDAFKPNLDRRLIPTTSEFNEIYEFENHPYQSFRAYEFIDIKRSNEHQIALDFRHMGQIVKSISTKEEATILKYENSNVDPRKLAMVNHVSSEKMTFEEIEKVEALIKNYHETSNSLKYQKEVKKYDKLYTSHSSEKNQTKFQESLNEVEDELREYEEELQTILKGKS